MRWMFLHALVVLAGSPTLAQWSTMEMDDGQTQHGGAAGFSKVYAVGGIDPNYDYTALIQVFDRFTGAWNEDPLFLDEVRGKIACAVNGDRMICGGGIDFNTLVESATVEVYDLNTSLLETTYQLSEPRVELSVASVGDKVIFAGGADMADGTPFVCNASDAVDIYDVPTGTWTTATLSEARCGMASAVSGDRVFFAGGYKGNGEVSDRVDIYDASSGTWSQATLSQARAFYGGGTAAGTKVFFAGGQFADETTTALVDVYDTATDTWSTAYVSAPRYGIQATSVGDYALFAGGGPTGFLVDWYYDSSSDAMDIYDAGADTWSSTVMSAARINFLAATAGNQAFFVGGYDFVNGLPTTCDVFTDASTSGIEEQDIPGLHVWPNPFEDVVHFGSLDALGGCVVEVYDPTGRLVGTRMVKNTLLLDLGWLGSGTYSMVLRASDTGRSLGRATLMKE